MGDKTICEVGCLMSSVSMGLAGTKISIPAKNGTLELASPGSLNVFLRQNTGYDDNSLIENQVCLIDPTRVVYPDDGMHKTNDLSFDDALNYIENGRIVILNVDNGGHFVLATGSTGPNLFSVNDPGFELDSYSYSEVVGYRIYDMKRP